MPKSNNEQSTFIEWIQEVGQTKVASGIGVSKQVVWNWTHGKSKPKPIHAVRLVTFSEGALTLEDIYGN